MGVKLFSHNQAAYEAAIALLKSAGKAAVIHPTGTGKSFLAFRLCEDFPDKTVCWLSPSGYIYQTQLANWEKAGGEHPANIRFYTYAKLVLLQENELKGIRPDYIVLDEFHRCGAEVWGRGVDRLLELYPDVPVLGLSATNIRYLDNGRDMADELFGDCIASQMTLGEAVARGILHPPGYVTAFYSWQKDLEKYTERVGKLRDGTKKRRAEQYLEALRRALSKADGLDAVFARHMPDCHGKYIVFCAHVEHMREMMEESEKWFRDIDPQARRYSVYSGDPESEQSFADFREDRSDHLRLLFCIDALNEGIHVEGIDGVILLRPTISPTVYKQQIGRALSADSRQASVIFDIVNNIAGLYSISAVEDEMREAVQYYRFLGEEKEIVHEHFRVIDEVQDCRKLFEGLEETLSPSWEAMYAEAKQYYEEHGDLLPGQDYVTESGRRLGRWVITQRNSYRRGGKDALSPVRIKKLEDIGMCWQGRNERLWEAGFDEAKHYFEDHGDLDIPAVYTSEEGSGNGLSLGTWYRGVRRQYRLGRLSAERQRRLEAIGMRWEPARERTWMQYYELAKAYREEHGDLNIPADYETPDGLKLGVWISGQRQNYRKGMLTGEQTGMLDGIGMSWHRFASRWEEAYQHAEAFYKERGALDPAAGYVTEDGFALGKWVNEQRRKYRVGKLKESQIQRLEVLGITWNPTEALWQEGFRHARRYLESHGNLNVPGRYASEDGYRLGAWIANQRTRDKDGRMTDAQREMLDGIGMVFRA